MENRTDTSTSSQSLERGSGKKVRKRVSEREREKERYHGNRKLNQKGNHVQRFRVPAAESASIQSAEDQQSRAGT